MSLQNNILDVYWEHKFQIRELNKRQAVASHGNKPSQPCLGFWKSEWAFQNNILDVWLRAKFPIGIWI